ncbi:MAG: hypothetical protein ABDH25_01350 [Dictyoglomaceae bacterium]
MLEELKKLGASKIILFGSLAHGDVDLLVIMPNTKSGKEWSNLIYL